MSQRLQDVNSSLAQTTVGTNPGNMLDYNISSYQNCSVRVVSEIQGRDTSNGDTLSVTVYASFNRATGDAALITQAAGAELRSAGFLLLGPSATALASGTNIRIQVTGMSGHTIEWWVYSRIYVN